MADTKKPKTRERSESDIQIQTEGIGLPIGYKIVRTMFRMSASVFYATTEVYGLENVPPEGTPALICFNHGNGLGDPIVLIRKTPRTIRFCAKNTLWNIPIIGDMIRHSGAVPVYRKRDVGDEAGEKNLETFRTVIGALQYGDCVGFAPEGVSRFLPYMEQPLKTGVARIALEAVQQAKERGDESYKVNIVPTGLIFTHREKFRSDLCIRYCEPIVIDVGMLPPEGDKEASFKIARELTNKINEAILSVTINAPDWNTTRLAMTATRLYRPLGTQLTLGEYSLLLRGWVEVLKGKVNNNSTAHKEFTEKLEAYQNLLDKKKIKDERVRRAAVEGPLPRCWLVTGIIQRIAFAIVTFAVALPGLIIWLPVWLYVKRRERLLLQNGPRWNDSVAETKMFICFFATVFISSATLIYGAIFRDPYSFFFVFYLFITMRCYEEAVADVRSAYTLQKLLFLYPSTMKRMLKLRAAAKKAVEEHAYLLDENAKIGEDGNKRTALDYYLPWLIGRMLRRQKKDWNEVLRLNDHNTMDYVE